MATFIQSKAFEIIVNAAIKNTDRKLTVFYFTLEELQFLKDTTVSQFREFLKANVPDFYTMIIIRHWLI